MSDVFTYMPNRSIKGLDAQTVGETLAQIRQDNHGNLTAEGVVDAATDPAHPLHSAFEWDDTEAACKWRLQQAGRIITSVRVINLPVQPPVPVSAYVSVRKPEEDRRSYHPSVEVLSNEVLKQRVLDALRRHIENLERKYAHFQELADALAHIKKAVG
jgi:hypothetical protein